MEHKIEVTKRFRYFTEGDRHSSKKLLIVLHGYGQLPNYFIRKFSAFKDDFFIVAPEGMHRFYLKGSSGRVGASWMTKEAREDDIQDNISFLNELLVQLKNEHNYESITILGYSQGGATAARWFYQLKEKNAQLILWASVFPPDLAIEQEIPTSTDQENHFVLGLKDQYFSEDAQKNTLAFYQSINFNIHTFDGDHDIDPTTLLQILQK